MHSACNAVKKEFVCNSLFSIPLVEAMITYLKDKVGVVDFANAQRVVKGPKGMSRDKQGRDVALSLC